MGNSALSEISLSSTRKFSNLDAVESVLLGLSITKNNNFRADAERWDLNLHYSLAFLRVMCQGTNSDSSIPGEMVVHNSGGFVGCVLHMAALTL